MIWIGVSLVALVALFIIAMMIWRPEKNVGGDEFAHWIESLIRFYVDSSSLLIKSKSHPIWIRFYRRDTRGDGCTLLLEIPNEMTKLVPRQRIMEEFQKQGYGECVVEESLEAESLVACRIEIDNIWNIGVGNRAARLSRGLFDASGVGELERFDLFFSGEGSLERTRESRHRLPWEA